MRLPWCEPGAEGTHTDHLYPSKGTGQGDHSNRFATAPWSCKAAGPGWGQCRKDRQQGPGITHGIAQPWPGGSWADSCMAQVRVVKAHVISSVPPAEERQRDCRCDLRCDWTPNLHTPTQKVSVGIKDGVPQVRNTALSWLGPVSLVQRTRSCLLPWRWLQVSGFVGPTSLSSAAALQELSRWGGLKVMCLISLLLSGCSEVEG